MARPPFQVCARSARMSPIPNLFQIPVLDFKNDESNFVPEQYKIRFLSFYIGCIPCNILRVRLSNRLKKAIGLPFTLRCEVLYICWNHGCQDELLKKNCDV